MPVAEPPSAIARALRWSVDGLRWWRRAPWLLLLLCLIQMVVEGLLQLIPWAGLAVSKVAVPLLVLGILQGLQGMAQGKRLRLACLIGSLHRKRLLSALALAALWGWPVFGVQQWCAYLAYGWPAVDAVLFGHMAAHRELANLQFSRILLVSGVLPGILLMLAPFLWLFRGASPWQAVVGSVRIALSHAAPFAWFLLLNLLLFGLMLATPWTFVLVVLLVPWSVATSYAIWRDVGADVPQLRGRAAG